MYAPSTAPAAANVIAPTMREMKSALIMYLSLLIPVQAAGCKKTGERLQGLTCTNHPRSLDCFAWVRLSC